MALARTQTVQTHVPRFTVLLYRIIWITSTHLWDRVAVKCLYYRVDSLESLVKHSSTEGCTKARVALDNVLFLTRSIKLKIIIIRVLISKIKIKIKKYNLAIPGGLKLKLKKQKHSKFLNSNTKPTNPPILHI